MRLTAHHRPPRAGIDPIDCDEVGLAAVLRAVSVPFRSETIVVCLDGERRAVALVAVTDTEDPDAVVEIVELLTRPSTHGGRVAGVVIGSVRPAGRHDPGDVDRWLEASDLAEQHGVDLVEWYVVDHSGVACPRDSLGEPPRW